MPKRFRNGSVLRNRTSASNINSEADAADAVSAVTEYNEYDRVEPDYFEAILAPKSTKSQSVSPVVKLRQSKVHQEGA